MSSTSTANVYPLDLFFLILSTVLSVTSYSARRTPRGRFGPLFFGSRASRKSNRAANVARKAGSSTWANMRSFLSSKRLICLFILASVRLPNMVELGLLYLGSRMETSSNTSGPKLSLGAPCARNNRPPPLSILCGMPSAMKMLS